MLNFVGINHNGGHLDYWQSAMIMLINMPAWICFFWLGHRVGFRAGKRVGINYLVNVAVHAGNSLETVEKWNQAFKTNAVLTKNREHLRLVEEAAP